MNFVTALLPELILVSVASLLFLLGAVRGSRQTAPWLALAGLLAAFAMLVNRQFNGVMAPGVGDTIAITQFAGFIKLLTCAIGALLLLLQWPTDKLGEGNGSLSLQAEGPEYLGLMLLSLTGVMLVASANDLILLFLGIELASIPTYVMVSISRPIAVAQEAAVKYFFLGAFSAAITLFGLSFIFGATGSITLSGVGAQLATATGDSVQMSGWTLLGAAMVILGLAFKLAAFPLHFYAPDVYTGAATPLTALLSFVPKTAGTVALIRVLYALAGGHPAALPVPLATMLWVMAVASMTIGNVLGLMQHNIKRMMACSSIAHSGYLLAGIYVIFSSVLLRGTEQGLSGVMFYLVAYGIMNAGVFAVLMMLPAKADPFIHDGKIPPATTAETFAEIAGSGRRNPGLALIMAICCFSLIGIPLTVGFNGKFFLLWPILWSGAVWLAIIMVLNAAISAGYYLRLVSAMFLKDPRPEDQTPGCTADGSESACYKTVPLVLAGVISAGGSLLLGCVIPATTQVRVFAADAMDIVPRGQVKGYPSVQAPESQPQKLAEATAP